MHYPSTPETNIKQIDQQTINEKNIETDLIHIIINENRKANALYIIANLNNENIEVTIDSGANINCIRPDLIDPKLITPSNKYQLSGPDKTPLIFIGTATINIQIEDTTFSIPVCVVKNLSSTIILGNEFLANNKAKIDYTKQTMTLNKFIKTKIMNNKFTTTERNIKNIENKNITQANNITETNTDILNTKTKFSIAHTISADLQHNTELSTKLTQKYGNMSHILDNLDLIPGEITTIETEHRTIHYLISKDKYDTPSSYIDIFDNLYNLKNSAIIEGYEHIALCNTNITNNELDWEIIKNMIFEIFSQTNIRILICNTLITVNNKKTNIISNIKNTYNRITDTNKTKPNKPKFVEIFSKYQMGENVPSDGNCGLYALTNAINDNKVKKIVTLAKILNLLNLTDLPNYWWHDDQLASIANHYGFDTYIYSDKNKVGYVYGSGFRPPIILYNINNGTHWCPGTIIKNTSKSNKVPTNIIHTENYISIEHIKDKCELEINKKNITKQNNELQIINTIITHDRETIYDNEGTPINISKHITLQQHNQTINLIKQFIHIFSTDTINIKPANIEPCQIKIKPNSKEPKFNPPHRVSPSQRQELKIQLDKLIQANIVKHTKSNFASPAFLVRKKEKNSYRLVVSYKELNNIIESDQYPLPRTMDLFRSLEGSKYFSCIDLNSGFFQVPVKAQDQYMLAFTTVHGLMTFTRLPQGFKNSSAIFQRELNKAFSEQLYKSVIIFIDDLATFGQDFETALNNLKKVFETISHFGFSLKTAKCTLFAEKIELLGHQISNEGIKPLTRNTIAITNFEQPKTAKQVRSFLGLCSYYRRLVKNFSHIANPLFQLTKHDNNKHIIWTNEHNEAFNKLKTILTSEPVIAHFSDDKDTYLTVDASLIGLGAVLEQPDEYNKLKPIGYASRKVLDSEKTYSSTTLELLGLVFGITYFREYLWGRKFTVYSDNISLQYYKNLKIPSARIARLTLKILDFDFTIKHKAGKENKVADCLSREHIMNIIDAVIFEHDTHINQFETIHNINTDKPTEINIIQSQKHDDFCSEIMKALNNIPTTNKYKKISRRYTITNQILYLKRHTPKQNIDNAIVIPKNLIQNIITAHHNPPLAAHMGITKTIKAIQIKYFWPTLVKDVTLFIKTCHQCQINKKAQGKPAGYLQPIPLTTCKPLDRITIDFLGPLPSSNNKKYILVFTCQSSKYVIAKATKSSDANTVAKFLIHYITQFGVPRYLTSDRGLHFKNKIMNDTCQNFGIKQIFSSSYAPQSQGFTERINGVICQAIKHYIKDNNQSRWSFYLPYIIFSYNNSPQISTNYSPYYLLHGFNANTGIDIQIIPENLSYDIKKSLEELKQVRQSIPEYIKKAQETQKTNHDKLHKLTTYEPNQLVLVKFPFNEPNKTSKLAPKYRGPYKVISKINDVNYIIELILNNKLTKDIVHIRRLKPYFQRENTETIEDKESTDSGN